MQTFALESTLGLPHWAIALIAFLVLFVTVSMIQRATASNTLVNAAKVLEAASTDGTTVTGNWKGRAMTLSVGTSQAAQQKCFILRTDLVDGALRLRDQRLGPQRAAKLPVDFATRYEILAGHDLVSPHVEHAAYEVSFAASLAIVADAVG